MYGDLKFEYGQPIMYLKVQTIVKAQIHMLLNEKTMNNYFPTG